jgi:hypothetical protein
VDREYQRWPGWLAEVEVADQVAEDLLVLADVWPGVWPSVGGGVETLVGDPVKVAVVP